VRRRGGWDLGCAGVALEFKEGFASADAGSPQLVWGDLRLSCPFVNDSVLHDDCEVLTGIPDQVDIRERIPIDQQKVGQCAFFNNPKFALIRRARTA